MFRTPIFNKNAKMFDTFLQTNKKHLKCFIPPIKSIDLQFVWSRKIRLKAVYHLELKAEPNPDKKEQLFCATISLKSKV